MYQKVRQFHVTPADFAFAYKKLAKSILLNAKHQADATKKRKLLNEAVSTYEQALKYFEQSGDNYMTQWSREIASCYKYLGEVHSQLSNTKAAKSWHSKHKQLTSRCLPANSSKTKDKSSRELRKSR